jgi:Na+/glutamate symporter
VKTIEVASWLAIVFGLLCCAEGCSMANAAETTKDDAGFRRAKAVGFSGAALGTAGLIGTIVTRQKRSPKQS